MSVDAERVNRYLFRNSLIHRYWIMSDSRLLTLVRGNSDDFEGFIAAIQAYVSPK